MKKNRYVTMPKLCTVHVFIYFDNSSEETELFFRDPIEALEWLDDFVSPSMSENVLFIDFLVSVIPLYICLYRKDFGFMENNFNELKRKLIKYKFLKGGF